MATPQTGIFALGDSAHIYLEFAALPGLRDALTRYSTPKTGGYCFVPSLQGLGRFAPPEDD